MSSPRKSTTMGVENISKSDQMSSPISSRKPPPKCSSPAPGASPTVRRALPRRSGQVGPRPTTPLDAKISPLAKSTPLETKTSFSAAKSGSSDAKTTVSGTTTISYARSTSAETKTAQLTRPVSSEDKSRLQTNTNLDGKISPRAKSPLPQTKRASVASKSTETKTKNLVAKISQRAKSPLPENKITKTTFKSTGATSLNSDVTTSERTQSPHPQTKIATAISKTAEAKPTNLEIKTLQRAKSPLPDTKIATATSKSTPPAKPPRRSLKNVNSINSANGDTRKRLSEADVELRSKSPATAEMSSPETLTHSRKSAVPIRRPHSELVASSDDLRVDTSNSKSTKVQHIIRQFNSFNSFRNARDVARERAQRLADLRPKTPTDKGVDRNSRSGTPSDTRIQRTSRPETPTDKNSVDKRRTSTPADIGVGTGTPTEKNSVDRRRTSTPVDIGIDRTSRPKTPANKIVDRTSRPGTPTDKSLKRTSNPIKKQRTSDIPVSQSPVPFNKSSNESVTSTSEKSSSKSIRNSGKCDTSQDDLAPLNSERAEKLSANRSLPSLPVSASSNSKEESKIVDKTMEEKTERSIPITRPRKLPQSTIVSINSRTSQVQSLSNPVQSRPNTARSPTPTDTFKLTTAAPFKRAQSPLLKISQGKVTQVKLSESVTKKPSLSNTDKASDSSSETKSVEHDDSFQNTNIGQSNEMNLKSDKSTTSENTDQISEENFEYDTSVKSANINPAKSPYFRRKILPIKKGPEVVTKPNTNPKFPFSKSPVPDRFLSRNTNSKTNIRNAPNKSVDTSSSFSENLPTNNGSKDNAKADPSEKFAMVEGSLEDDYLSVISAVESSVDPPREPDDIIWDNCEISTSEILITDTNQNIVKDYVKERIPASNQCGTDNGIENKKSSDRSNMLDHAMEDKYMANQNNVKDVTMKIASSIVGHHSDTEGPKSANQNSEDIQEWKKNSVNANASRVTENPPNLNNHEGTSESVDDNALDVESVNKANKNVANDNTDEIDDHEVQNITHKDQTTTDTRKNLQSGSININAVDNDLSVNEPDIEEDLTVKSAMRYPVGNCRENKTKGLNPSLTKNALQNKLTVLDADQSKAEKENKSDFLSDTSSSDTHSEPSVNKSSIRDSSEKQNKASAVNETETNVNNNNDLSIEEDLSVISVSISEEDVNKARRKLYHKNVPLNSPRPVSRKLSENKFLRMDKMQGNLSFKKEEEAPKSQAAGTKFSISESSDSDSKFNNSLSTPKGSSGDDSAIESSAGLESPSRPAITKLQTDTFSKVPKPSVEQESDSKLNIKDSTQNIHHQSTTSNAKDGQNFREKLLRGSADGEESGIIDDSVFCEDDNENSAVLSSAISKKGDALRSIPHPVNKKDSETSQTDFNTHVMQHSSPKLLDKMEGQESSGKDTYNENHSQHSFPKRPDTLHKLFKQQNVLQSSIGSLPYQSYHESSSPKSESIDTKVSKVTSGQMNHSASTIHGKEFSKGMASRYFDIRNANMTQEPSRFVFRSTTEATVSSSSDFVDTEAKDSGYCDVKEVSLEYRKASDRINTALVTLRSELKAMREQDLVLLRQLITISETIQRLSGTRKLRLSKSLSLSYGGLQPRSIRGQSTSSLERQNSAPHMEEMKRQLFSSTRHLGSAEADSMSSIGEYEFDSTSDLDETCFSSTSTLSLFHQFSPASPEPRPHSTHGHHIADVTISLESLDGSGGSYEEILRRNVRLWKLSVQTHKPVIEEVTCLL